MNKRDTNRHANVSDIRFSPLSLICVGPLVRAGKHRGYNEALCAVNDSLLRLCVFQGDYQRHDHDSNDELFFVLEGCLVVDLGERSVVLNQWDGFVIPKGVEYQVRSPSRAVVLMVEKASGVPTGDLSWLPSPSDTLLR